MPPSTPVTIYTVGYASWNAGDLAAMVNDVEGLLVDVRLRPYSSKPGFSKDALQSRYGDSYIHLPGFGNLQYRSSGMKLNDPARAIEALTASLSGRNTAIIMCGCADHRRCHRTAVADFIEQQWSSIPLTVEHRYPSDRTGEPSLFSSR